jgi:hypothetical protein
MCIMPKANFKRSSSSMFSTYIGQDYYQYSEFNYCEMVTVENR